MLKKSVFLFALLIFLMPLASANVIINEVMYNPNNCDDNFCEWIELYNNGEESVDLNGWLLCSKNLSAGYIDRNENIHSETTTVLPAKSYAIITDGGSGTEVYNNFAIDSNAIALHVDASSLCGGLSNSGKLITLKDKDAATIDSTNYDGSLANGDGNSLQFCGNWMTNVPTPGKDCPAEQEEQQPENNASINIINNTNENLSELPEEKEIAINNSNETVKEPYEKNNNTIAKQPKTDSKISITGQAVKQESADNKTSDSNNSEVLYESKSGKMKENAIYIFAALLLGAIAYIAIKDKA